VSAVPYGATQAILGFRINCQGAIPTDVIIDIPPIEKQDLRLANDAVEQTYDEHYDYLKD